MSRCPRKKRSLEQLQQQQGNQDMQVPLRIVVKGLPEPARIRGRIEEAATLLEKFHGRVTACRVAVTNPDSRHSRGGLYDVRVVLRVPGHKDVAISQRVGDDPKCEHIGVALRKAFAQARRRLQDVSRKMRGDIKVHADPKTAGRVVKLFARSGYGIIESADGQEFYFHRNSVLNGGFSTLKIGTTVQFVEREGEKGPQASTVTPTRATRMVKRLK
jgi:cold shock CspA family protein